VGSKTDYEMVTRTTDKVSCGDCLDVLRDKTLFLDECGQLFIMSPPLAALGSLTAWSRFFALSP
jgi:hypothetical protein